jgi:hypothetical protein
VTSDFTFSLLGITQNGEGVKLLELAWTQRRKMNVHPVKLLDGKCITPLYRNAKRTTDLRRFSQASQAKI